MNRFTKQTASYWKQLGSVVRNEFRTIFKDGGVMLILIFALIIYATAYSLAYGSQVLRNVPIGVVDECRTPTSRSLIDTFNAGPNTYVAYNPTSMEEAKELFYGRKIYGVVYIPSDYGEKLYGGEQANVAIYADASYFLMYRQVFQEVVTSIGKTGAMVEFQRLIAKGANIPQAQATTQPVIYQSHNLFNPYLGYGTFVMPAIIMVIIQQTMLIGIGMIGGTWREFGLYRKLCPAGRRRMSTLPIVLGRGLVYALIYAVTCTYILGLHYRLFLDPGADAQRRVVPAPGHSRLAVQPRTAVPEQPRRQRLHPYPDHGGLDPRGFRRNQVAHHPHGRLRRTGLHRHSPGDRPRTTGTSRPEGKRGRRALTAPYTRKKRRRILVRRLFCE